MVKSTIVRILTRVFLDILSLLNSLHNPIQNIDIPTLAVLNQLEKLEAAKLTN